jgi:hypothetical protein
MVLRGEKQVHTSGSKLHDARWVKPRWDLLHTPRRVKLDACSLGEVLAINQLPGRWTGA